MTRPKPTCLYAVAVLMEQPFNDERGVGTVFAPMPVVVLATSEEEAREKAKDVLRPAYVEHLIRYASAMEVSDDFLHAITQTLTFFNK